MWMRSLFVIWLSFAFLASPASASEAGWNGAYSYTHDGGRTAGGSPIVHTWRLTVSDTGCLFHGEGFQLLQTFRCSTVRNTNRLDVYFVSYGDGGATNPAGVATYKQGDRLFTLLRDGKRLLTQWGRFVVEEELPPTPAVWFKTEPESIGTASARSATEQPAATTPREVFGTAVVVDEDTLLIAGTSVDLWTIDAPELDQPCTRARKPWNCGELSRQHLARLVGSRSVACRREGPPEAKIGFVGLCFVTDEPCARGTACESDLQSLNLSMVHEGWAFDEEGQYMDPQEAAKKRRIGLWAGQVRPPWEWKADRR
jgi:endonuclease YncB( thermonuclease family)